MPEANPSLGGSLPSGWAAAQLRQLIALDGLISDGDWIESKDQDPNGDVRLIQLADIGDGIYRNRSSRFLTQATARELGCTLLRPSDVLVARMPDPLGRACVFPGDPRPSVTAVDVCVIRTGLLGVDRRWLMHTLNAPQTRSAIEAHARGTTRLRVSRRNLETLWLPVPPVSEQKRIVVKVEELLAHVNAARERLEHVPAVLKRFRQSVLAAACSGRLTAEWRETGTSTSNGMELMQQIDRERQGSRSLSRSRRHDAEGDDSAAAARSWEVPDTWEWARINDLLHYERNAAYGVLQPGIDSPDGVPFVRVCDLVNGTVDTRCLKRIDPDIDKRYPRTRLHGGEVLVTLVGTIGRIAVVPEELAGANVARAIGMLPLCPHVLPQFLRLALENPAKNMELVDLAREVARKTLNLGLLKDVTVPLPPLEEQHEIVRRVDALWRSASGASLGVRAATERASALSRAILAKAFRGELVPTEAELARAEGRDYESAEALLERIGNGRSRPEQRTPPRRARRPGS